MRKRTKILLKKSSLKKLKKKGHNLLKRVIIVDEVLLKSKSKLKSRSDRCWIRCRCLVHFQDKNQLKINKKFLQTFKVRQASNNSNKTILRPHINQEQPSKLLASKKKKGNVNCWNTKLEVVDKSHNFKIHRFILPKTLSENLVCKSKSWQDQWPNLT